jgi:hypothetical protein
MSKDKSNGATPAPAATAAMPAQPFTWVTQYRFYVEGGVVKIAFGERDTYFAAVAMPINLAVELLSQLGAVVRDQIVADVTGQAAAPKEGTVLQ